MLIFKLFFFSFFFFNFTMCVCFFWISSFFLFAYLVIMLEAFLECLVIHSCLYLRVWIIFKNLVVPLWVWVSFSGLVDFTLGWMDRELVFFFFFGGFCPKFCLPLIPLGHSVFPEENFPASSLGWEVRDGRWEMSWLLPLRKLSWEEGWGSLCSVCRI